MSRDVATLLVVDDDAEIRELIQAYLDKQGYQVICVEDGSAMDEALAESSVDLILLDLMLPGRD
jgi:two-component system OmpR family response regulator